VIYQIIHMTILFLCCLFSKIRLLLNVLPPPHPLIHSHILSSLLTETNHMPPFHPPHYYSTYADLPTSCSHIQYKRTASAVLLRRGFSASPLPGRVGLLISKTSPASRFQKMPGDSIFQRNNLHDSI